MKTFGARVNSVDEEGEVTLYLYSARRTFSFRADYGEHKDWGARLGDYVTITVTEGKYEDQG